MTYLKFGPHAAGVGGVYDGLGEYIAACNAAGVPCVVASVNNAGPVYTVQELGRPFDVLLFRLTLKGGDGVQLDQANYNADPLAYAAYRMDELARLWPPELDHARVYVMAQNEPGKDIQHEKEWTAAFNLRCGEIAVARGWRFAAYGWSMGAPEADFWELPATVAYLRLCSDHPDLLAVSLHEYSGDDDITDNYPYFIGRFEFLHDECDDRALPYPPIVIGEFGWREAALRPSPGSFRSQLQWAQDLYGAHDNILGAAIWTLGNWHGTVAADLAGHMGELAQMASEYDYTPPVDPSPADCCDELRARLDALEARVTALENAGTKPPPDPDPDPPPPIPDPVSTNGVDIARYQVGINWPVFKQGLGFIFIKVGSGENPTDPMFADHWQNAAGVLRGTYWYQYPDSVMPAAQQAASFWAQLPKDCELPPMLDVEQSGLTRAMVQAFVDAFTAVSGGMMLGIYTSASKWSQLTGNLPLPNCPLWVAHWTIAKNPLIPPTWSTWVFWQYTSDGKRPGFGGRLDLDRFNGTAAQLGQFARSWPRAGWTPGTPPPPPPPSGQTVAIRPYIEPTGDVGQFTVLAHLGGAWTQDQQLQRRADGSITLVKGNTYERWRIAANGDMLRYEDTSMSAAAAYTQNGARWLPAVVAVGDTYVNTPRVTVKRKADCAVLSDQATADYLTIAALHKSWTSPANPALSFADVLEVHWRKSPSGPVQEVYFLAPHLCYVAWGAGVVEAAVSELPQGRPSLPWQSWGCG